MGILLRLGLLELFDPLLKPTYSNGIKGLFLRDPLDFFVLLLQLFLEHNFVPLKLLSLVYKHVLLLLRQGLGLVARDQLRLLGVCLS